MIKVCLMIALLLIAPANAVISKQFASDSQEFAAIVKVKIKRLTNKGYLYEYTVTNPISNGFNISGFTIDIGDNARLHSITKKGKWRIDYDPEYASPENPFGPSISWDSFDPSVEVPPGSTVKFSFISHLPPSKQGYEVRGWSIDGAYHPKLDGDISGPGAEVRNEDN